MTGTFADVIGSITECIGTIDSGDGVRRRLQGCLPLLEKATEELGGFDDGNARAAASLAHAAAEEIVLIASGELVNYTSTGHTLIAGLRS